MPCWHVGPCGPGCDGYTANPQPQPQPAPMPPVVPVVISPPFASCRKGPCGYHCTCFSDIDWDKPGCQWCQILSENENLAKALDAEREKARQLEHEMDLLRRERKSEAECLQLTARALRDKE